MESLQRLMIMAVLFGGSNSGSGVVPPGSVTSVATQSDSLKNNSAPNPIIGVGTVEFEVQIIDGTYVAIALLDLGGLLLEGVIYRITDFNLAIGGGITLKTAEFMTVKDNSGNTILSTSGTAHSTAANLRYEISYDIQNDYILELYLPEMNQRASRSLLSGTNEIENFPWEDVSCKNVRLVESNLSTPGTLIIVNSEILNSTLSFSTFNVSVISCHIFNSTIAFNAACTFEKVVVKPGCTLDISDSCTNGTFEEFCSTIVVAGPVTNFRVGQGESYPIDSGTQVTALIAFEGDLHTLFINQVVDAGNTTIPDSRNLTNYVHLDVDAGPPVLSCTVTLPANPIDRQVWHFGASEAAAGVVIAGNGHTVVNSIAVFAKNQHFAYYYDLGTDTYYLV